MKRSNRISEKTKVKQLLLSVDEPKVRIGGASGGSVPNTKIIIDESMSYRIVTTAANGGNNAADVIMSGSGSNATMVSNSVLTDPVNGRFFVIGTPGEVIGTLNSTSTSSTQRVLAPKLPSQSQTNETLSSSTTIITPGASSSATPLQREEKRRATHNEVERRRRDNINTWIVKLDKLIPVKTYLKNEILDQESGNSSSASVANNSCSGGGVSNNSKATRSKGDILARACEYVVELKNANHRLAEKFNETEIILANQQDENKQLSEQISTLEKENQQLKELLKNPLVKKEQTT